MKKGETARKVKKLTAWIISLSVLGLLLISVLPWISVSEDDMIKGDLHFNFEMMKKSSNIAIQDLADELDYINILFWALIILGLLSFIGATLHASGKILPIAFIILLIGCVTLIVSILIVLDQISIIRTIEEANAFSASSLFPHFYYAYIPFIFGILSLISSAVYTKVVVSHSIDKFKTSKKEKKTAKKKVKEKKETKKPIKKEDDAKIKKAPVKPPSKKLPEKSATKEKKVEMEQWLKDEVKSIEGKTEAEKYPGVEEQTEDKLQKKQPFPEEKTPVKKEISEETEEVPISKSFEKALYSAIDKKQNEIDSQEPPKAEDKKTDGKKEIPPPVEEESLKNKVKVRCPQCKNIFYIEKEGIATKIKCPNCGKEGVIK